MQKLKLLDLFTGGGGAAYGYFKAGFDVTGVDIVPQPEYPKELTFIQGDALAFVMQWGYTFDVITASPPCKLFTQAMNLRNDRDYQRTRHIDYVTPTRLILNWLKRPYVIENVTAKILINPIMLCGTMFNLRVLRHRYFESNIVLTQPIHRKHQGSVSNGDYCGVYGMGGALNGKNGEKRKDSRKTEDWRIAMDINWMNRYELTQAIPPAYTYYIGQQLIRSWSDGQVHNFTEN